MAFSSIVRALEQSALTQELVQTLEQRGRLRLGGAPTLPQGFVTTAIANRQARPLCIIAATIEDAGRWAAQLDAMGWKTVHFYPSSESSPYEDFDPEGEMVWGQLQILAELCSLAPVGLTTVEGSGAEAQAGQAGELAPPFALVATERSLQPHLPPPRRARSPVAQPGNGPGNRHQGPGRSPDPVGL